MPQFRPKAMLEQTAAADLFKHTLSKIPTVFGRISYLASLRDPNLGAYQHHGLAAIFGREESRKALQQAHDEAFQEWLRLPLSTRRGDLNDYLRQLEAGAPEVVRSWMQTQVYRTYVPDSARQSETELFLHDLGILLQTFRRPKSKAG